MLRSRRSLRSAKAFAGDGGTGLMTLSIKPILALAVLVLTAAAPVRPSYRFAANLPLGAPDRWDYAVAEPAAGRVYVAHGDSLAVIDARAVKVIGTIRVPGAGMHGVAFPADTALGFTDDGDRGRALAFDRRTLKLVKAIPAPKDADAVAADPLTGHVFIVAGDPRTIAVIDPKTLAIVATVRADEAMEYAAAGADGTLYVAGAGRNDLLAIDTRTNRIVRHWPMRGCANPHGLAYDRGGRRLFMGCVNGVMMAVDAGDGHVVTTLPIGRGSDAIAFDPRRKRIFSANGKDGSVTVYQQFSPDHYRALAPLRTAVSARTMTVDPASGRLFVVAADPRPGADADGASRIVPSSLHVLVFDPVE